MKWQKRKPVWEPDPFSSVLQQVAEIRGIDNLEDFISPSFSALNSPYLLENIEKAAEIIIKHVNLGNKMTVFCDFDNDGICSGVMMYRYLKGHKANVNYLIYPRSLDHGLRGKDIPHTDLLIIVDSSTDDAKECQALVNCGIEVVIIDHHPSTVENPYATIVNNQMGEYPNRSLSGAGVVLKVLEVLDDGFEADGHKEYYDLAATGIIGDMMPLEDMETRAIVHYGMKNITNAGIKKILKTKQVDLLNVTTTNIAFSLVPIINAATRMDEPKKVVDLLLSDDPDTITVLLKECLALNESRKTKQQFALDNLEFDNTHNVIFCVANELAGNMRGLIASNLANEHQKPAIVVKYNEATGVYEGSGRGYNTASFRDILTGSRIVDAKGHDNAFGVQVHKRDFPALIAYCDKALTDAEQVLYYDLEVVPEEITEQFLQDIARFNRLTGKECDPIKVKVNNLSVVERKIIGKAGGNVKITTEENFPLVKFGVADSYAQDVGEFDKISVIGQVQINKWWHNGLKKWVFDNQIIIDDYSASP